MNSCNILSFITDVKDSFFCDDEYICNILGLSQQEYEKKIGTHNFTLNDLVSFSNYFQVNIDDIVNNNVNFSTVKKTLFSPSNSLAPKYLENAGTYMSTIRAMLNYLKGITNENVTQYVLNKFELTKQVLINDDLLVNLELGNKVIEHIHKEHNFTEQDYIYIAHNSYDSPRIKQLINLIPQTNSTEQILQVFFENISKVEKNFDYTVSHYNEKYIVVKSKSKPEINEFFHSAKICERPGTMMRCAVIKLITAMLGKQLIEIDHVADYTKKNAHHIDYYIKNSRLRCFH